MAKKKAKTAKPSKVQKKKELCFVIMPYGDWFDDYYSSIFVPAIESAGLEPHRADDLYRPSAIVSDIWEYTKAAKCILADLTEKNPNVFYELGLAHATAKPAILVTASMDDVPFDLRGLRVIEYDKNDPNWGSTLRGALESAIKETLASPLETVLPTFLKKPPTEEATQLSLQDRALIGLKQDIAMLRRDMQSGTRRPHRLEEADIGPARARQLIRDLIGQSIDDDRIVEALEPLGPPEDWIRAYIKEVRTPHGPERGQAGE